VYLKARLKLSAAEGVREAVLAGQGFAIASRWMFTPELKSGEVVSILDKWTLPAMDLWIIYPSGRLTSAKARAFVNWFEKTSSHAQ
jgi:DNA-binding transcriptional LysR family regulator